MQAGKESTIHKVAPHLKDILVHLKQMETLADELELGSLEVPDPFFPLVQKMRIDMVRRFGIWLNPEHEKFDPIIMAATLLHPKLRRVLKENERDIAKKGALQYSKKWYPSEGSQQAHSSVSSRLYSVKIPVRNFKVWNSKSRVFSVR
ncbi:hypothetical protein RvY_04459-2 [Ramazzottius varieornatus]|uniref:Uncharacterized protein n=1 Tax=Ramazzottius varieornatus TaxID=947166 RepID=A0A1D1V0Y5_RAMVA|nr:hypothetical protein RvY_04459-2 [Ramazzottius varieornatus]